MQIWEKKQKLNSIHSNIVDYFLQRAHGKRITLKQVDTLLAKINKELTNVLKEM